MKSALTVGLLSLALMSGVAQADGDGTSRPVITTLNLSNRSLSSDDLAALAALPSLQELDLSRSTLASSNFSSLGALKELKKLNLRATKICDADVAQFPALPKLETLDLSYCSISDKGIAECAKFPSLTTLRLQGLSVSATTIAALAKLPLKRLDLGRATGITGPVYQAIGKISTLEELNLSDAGTQDLMMAHIFQLPNLKDLNVSGTNVGDVGLKILMSGVPSLTTLRIGGPAVSAKGIAEFQAARPKVSLSQAPAQSTGAANSTSGCSASGNAAVFERTPIGNYSALGNYRLFEFSKPANMTERQAIEYLIATEMPRWVHASPEIRFGLNLSGVSICDVDVQRMVGLHRLSFLNLSRTQITDWAVKSVAANGKNLEWLEVNYTQVADAGMLALTKLQSLERLGIERTKVTSDGLAVLFANAKLGAVGCDQKVVTNKILRLFSHTVIYATSSGSTVNRYIDGSLEG